MLQKPLLPTLKCPTYNMAIFDVFTFDTKARESGKYGKVYYRTSNEDGPQPTVHGSGNQPHKQLLPVLTPYVHSTVATTQAKRTTLP